MFRALLLMMLFAAGTALSGCATPPAETPTARELYEEGTELHARADYAGAADKFEDLISTYPTSPYSQQAMLDLAYSYHRRGRHEEAADTADRFLDQFPDNRHAPYALYLKGLAYFREDRGVLDFIGRQDPSARDPREMRFAFETFSQLLEEHPDSRYAADAAKRMRYLINALARHDMLVGRYYFRRGAYLAAIGRAREVMRIYPDSLAVEDALALLRDSYEKLGATEARADALRLLELNYPDSEALAGRRPTPLLPELKLPTLPGLPELPALPQIEAPGILVPDFLGGGDDDEEEEEDAEKAEAEEASEQDSDS